MKLKYPSKESRAPGFPGSLHNSGAGVFDGKNKEATATLFGNGWSNV